MGKHDVILRDQKYIMYHKAARETIRSHRPRKKGKKNCEVLPEICELIGWGYLHFCGPQSRHQLTQQNHRYGVSASQIYVHLLWGLT